MDGKLFQEWLREVDRNFEMQVRKIVMITHFSHVTKSRIFKNLDLRKNAGLSRDFPEKPFQTPKIIFKSVKLIGQESLSNGHLLKSKILKFTFSREPTFQVLVRGSSVLKKT